MPSQDADPRLFTLRTTVRQGGRVPPLPARFACAHCGRSGTAADVATGWSVSTPPRPTGADRPRTAEEERVTALCPDCARSVLRDLEGKLDP